MKAALIVGIDHYEKTDGLFGCVNDAHKVKAVLERNGDGTVNFDCKLLTAPGSSASISRSVLIDSIQALFSAEADTVLFYFAGHGSLTNYDGFIMPSDASRADEGVSLRDVITIANQSKIVNKIIILDSCHSGITATSQTNQSISEISEGLTVLTASTKEQYASEENGQGVFTHLLVDALQGAAANLTGDISPGSVYAHIDQSLGGWEQRPMFKTNVKRFVSLRSIQPPIPLEDLKKINKLFPKSGYQFALDPTFEEEESGKPVGSPKAIPENVQKFKVLQKYNRLALLVPVGVPNMWNAAIESKTCKLTALGEHYRSLVEKNRI